jgi:hypothetical protein
MGEPERRFVSPDSPLPMPLDGAIKTASSRSAAAGVCKMMHARPARHLAIERDEIESFRSIRNLIKTYC